jgi:hypothetical protein
MIPPGNLIEIGYQELDETPMDVMRNIYRSLNFWPFVRARGQFRRYLKSQAGYRKNSYQFSETEIENVNRHWKFAFDAWGYPMQNSHPKVLSIAK